MADNKKKETTPLRSLLGGYDPMNTKKDAKYDPRMSVPPGGLYTTGFLGGASPLKKDDIVQTESIPTATKTKTKKPSTKPLKEDVKPKDVKKITKEVTQAIVEKKAVEDPSWYERNKKGLRDAGIIIAGGLASFGEGIKGGSQTAANEKIYQNLDAASKADEMELLEDPNSEQSKQAQALFTQLYGNRVKMPENLTAAQFSKQSPVFDKILQRKLMEMRANAPKASTSKPNPNMKEITQVKTFRDNLNQNLAELENIIKKKGTFELTGSTQNRKQQLINEIANQYNKMLDPNSVVRPEEAKQISETLGVDGLLTSNATALENIKGFRDQINRTASGKLSNLVDSQDDADALQYARENPNDPYSKQILAMFGGR